jgi:hypothetical protein
LQTNKTLNSQIMASFPDQDKVIREVGKAYDQINKIRALLLFKTRNFGDDALGMREEALQGLNYSLHIMKFSEQWWSYIVNSDVN